MKWVKWVLLIVAVVALMALLDDETRAKVKLAMGRMCRECGCCCRAEGTDA